jgi:6-phosphofructokinase 1
VKKNVFYAQSGGVTAVINASACGVIETARKHKSKLGRVYAGRNGILGALTEDMIDTTAESARTIAALRHTPGGAFGSARYKLKGLDKNRAEYERLIEVFKAHDIGYFFYNGGGDSMDTAHKVSQIGQELGYPIVCIGVPKTVDNDLPVTDTCPGFGSVAKYVAVSTREAALDVASMARTSTRVFVLEVMGRHAGWIAAAGGLAGEGPADAPHVILFPEIPFDEAAFLARVKESVTSTSTGRRRARGAADGGSAAEAGGKDAFGHARPGGVAASIAQLVRGKLGQIPLRNRRLLQRAARHIASRSTSRKRMPSAKRAELALAASAVMPTIVRASKPYRWAVDSVSLAVANNKEKMMPRNFISKDGFAITLRVEPISAL